MIKLLKKEFKLTASPITYIFISFSLISLIPEGYPVALSAFFVCMGIFYSFQFAREYNDTLYTALLPIKKRDVVTAKYLFTLSIELSAFVISVITTLITMLIFAKNSSPYNGGKMLNPNLSFLSFSLIIFAFFNIIFLGEHFKDSHRIGAPFVKFIIAAGITVIISEALHHLPKLGMLNAPSFNADIVYQIPIFTASLLFFVAGTLISLKTSIKKFEKTDVR